jgi:hypothetical protein
MTIIKNILRPTSQRQFYCAQDKADVIVDSYRKLAELDFHFSITPIDV